MAETWVVNASPLILLAKVGQLALIEKLSPGFIIPTAVVAEILAGPDDDPARKHLESDWGRRITPSAISSSIIEWGLGAGESSVLAVALEMAPAIAVLDDAAARAAAASLGIHLIGSIGVIIRAKHAGLLNQVKPVLSDLQQAGLFLDSTLIQKALNLAGEADTPT